MEFCTLHPINEQHVKAYVEQATSLVSPEVRDALWSGSRASSRGSNRPARLTERQSQEVSFALAQVLARQYPVFAADGLSLTTWEARVDRGLAMLIRPPARLLAEAGIDPAVVRGMPIRLDLTFGMMGGAYLPARLIPEAEVLLERNLRRSVRRMTDADMDAQQLQAMMIEAVRYARSNSVGLFEAIGLVDPYDSATWPTTMMVRAAPTDQELVERIAQAAKPDPKPGLLSRLRGRIVRTADANGATPGS
jgi:hypothetical protein